MVLIIDLRGNGGGSLQEANELTGLFIDKGSTVVVRNNRGRSERQEDPDSEQLYDGPMVVMIDRPERLRFRNFLQVPCRIMAGH